MSMTNVTQCNPEAFTDVRDLFLSHTYEVIHDLEQVGFQGEVYSRKNRFSFIIPAVVGVDPEQHPVEWQEKCDETRGLQNTVQLGINTDARTGVPVKISMYGRNAQVTERALPQNDSRWFMKIIPPFETVKYTHDTFDVYSWQLKSWENIHYERHANGIPKVACNVEKFILHDDGLVSINAIQLVLLTIKRMQEAKERLVQHKKFLER